MDWRDDNIAEILCDLACGADYILLRAPLAGEQALTARRIPPSADGPMVCRRENNWSATIQLAIANPGEVSLKVHGQWR
jgi:hypothetical protein